MKLFWKRFFTIGGWFTWVFAAVTVAGAVYTGVSANQSKKKAEGKAGALNKANQKALANAPTYQQPATPEYMPWEFKSNQKRAIEEDANYYARSDQDFKKRHAPTVQAEKLFEEGVLKDQKGEHELLPQLQAEYTRAGISNALGNLGTSTLAPGSAGEADLATNLGQKIDARQQQNRSNRMASLNMAEEIFPRRTFGMTGADYVTSSIADVSNKNAWAAANYERDAAAEAARVGQAQNVANAQMTSQNEMAKAQAAATAARDAAVTQSVNSGVGAIAKGYAGAGAAGTATTAAASPGTTSVSNAAVPRLVSVPANKSYNYTPSAGWKPTGGVYA